MLRAVVDRRPPPTVQGTAGRALSDQPSDARQSTMRALVVDVVFVLLTFYVFLPRSEANRVRLRFSPRTLPTSRARHAVCCIPTRPCTPLVVAGSQGVFG